MTTDHTSIFETLLDRDSRTICLFGDITEESVAKMLMGLHLLEQDDPVASIRLLINSVGGDYYAGIGVYDYIQSMPNRVDGLVFGSCMSTASIILQACDRRMVSRNSTIMVHNGTDGGAEHSVVDYERWAEHAKVHRNVMYKIYAERSGKTINYWQKKCANDYILTAEQAVAEGLADEII